MSELANNVSSIDAVLLAGGLGMRLREVVTEVPKSLAPIAGRPFLDYQLGWLSDQSMRRCILCLGYRAEMIMNFVGDGSRWNLKVYYSLEQELLGTAGAIRLAMPLLISKCCLVLNGDSLFDSSLALLLDSHRIRQAEVSLFLTRSDDSTRYGAVELATDDRVVCFREKGHPGSGLINVGVYLINRSLLEQIPPGTRLSLEQDIFPSWLGRGFYGVVAEGEFIDIGIPESYGLAQLISQKWQHYIPAEKNLR